MVNDSIGDLLTQIRNANAIKKEYIELPTSKVVESVCKLLKEYGFITDFKRFKDKSNPYKSLRVDLRYSKSGLPVVFALKRISKPGQRIYKGWQGLPVSKGGRGLVIVSTSRGVMSSLEAKKKNLGGEVWCEIF